MTWLYRLLTDDVGRCPRCKGTGNSPAIPSLLCRECLGCGLTGRGLDVRFDGRVERVCIHGVGHTISTRASRGDNWVHGCDGCCAEYARKENA